MFIPSVMMIDEKVATVTATDKEICVPLVFPQAVQAPTTPICQADLHEEEEDKELKGGALIFLYGGCGSAL